MTLFLNHIIYSMVYLKDPWLVRCRLQYSLALSDWLSRSTLLTTIFMLTIFSYTLPLIQLIQTPSMLPCLGYHRASQKYRTGWQRTTWNWTRKKTEFFIAASKHHMQNVSSVLFKVANESITPADTIRNLGVIFDAQMTIAAHIKSLCTSLNYQLRNISRIRRFLDHDTCHLIVRALILSRMDYGNGLLLGFNYNDIQRLQRIQNWSAKLIYRAKKFYHASQYLQELHWLPVRQRIIFKIMTVVYKCLTGIAPSYLTACRFLYRPAHTNLRSASDITRLTEHNFSRLLQSAVKRSFTHKAPQIWNTLPTNIRESDSLSSFKKCLKTHLFADYC